MATKMNWPDDFINKIICGDCLEVMKQMPDECVDMVMTSPPYWALRDYGIKQIFGGDKECEHKWAAANVYHDNLRFRDPNQTAQVGNNKNPDIYSDPNLKQGFCLKCGAWKGQLGLEPTPEMYIEHLTIIFNEVKRTLKKEGTLWLNMGDTYGGSGGAGGDYNIGGLREEQPKYKQPLKIMPKCLLMIPERLSWSLIQNGWILRNKIIWYKPNAMPSSVKDRFSNRWEGLFLFVKSSKPVYWTNKKTLELITKQPLGTKGIEGIDWEWKKLNGKLKKVSHWRSHNYYFDLDAVREPHKYDGRKDTLYKGGPKDMQIGKHERWPDPAGKNPGDVINAERKWNEVPGQITQSIARDHGGWYRKDGTPIVDFDKGKNPGDFWNINTQPFPEAHFAVFPETLCEKPIKAGCPEQVCKKCGKARERIIEKEKIIDKGRALDSQYVSNINSIKSRSHDAKRQLGGNYQKLLNQREVKIIGWTSCDCNAGFEGGVVFEPFAGAGTVGVVAKKLGRQFILIDIKEEYCDMAKRRIAKVGYQMELRI